MTELYVFSENIKTGGNMLENGTLENETDEKPDEIIVGGLSITGLLQKKPDQLNDSKIYSFFDNLAVPLGLHCFHDTTESSQRDNKEDTDDEGVIKNDIYDRLFYQSAKDVGNSTTSKKRNTRKKITK
jgi:hypothetical protein